MSSSIHPLLSHCGIYVRDVDKQVDFYRSVLGFVVADRGVSERLGYELAFLTAAADHHHQVVFISGRAPSGEILTPGEYRAMKLQTLDEFTPEALASLTANPHPAAVRFRAGDE